MNGYNFEYMNLLINYLTSQSSDFECTLIWWLFQKCVVRTKFDIYAFIVCFYQAIIGHCWLWEIDIMKPQRCSRPWRPITANIYFYRLNTFDRSGIRYWRCSDGEIFIFHFKFAKTKIITPTEFVTLKFHERNKPKVYRSVI
jgi:hypothetical protein